MKNKTSLCLAVLLFLIAGVACDYYGLNCPLESKSVTILKDGHPITEDFIQTPIIDSIYKIGAILAYTFAISIFVSVFVSESIERSRAKEQEQNLQAMRSAINVDVFDGLFKRLIHPEIFKSLREAIISPKIIRKNQHNIYDFKVDGNKITTRATFKYDVENITEIAANEVIQMSFLKESQNDRLLKLKCVTNDVEEILYDVDATNGNPRVQIEDVSNNIQTLKVDLSIPKGQKFSMIQVWQFYSETGFAHDFYASKSPLIDIEVTANFPEGYEFVFFPLMSIPIKNELSEKNRAIYSAKGGILPYQGFNYQLRKKV